MGTFNAATNGNDTRLALAGRWLAGVLDQPIESLRPASEDASFRRYFRVATGGRTLILMDAPPANEPVDAFLRVAGWMRHCAVHVPEVLAAERAQGFVLLEDLGDESYFSALQRTPARAERLYRDAIAALVTLQHQGRRYQSLLPPYDAALLQQELALFTRWLCGEHLRLSLSRQEQRLLAEVFDSLCTRALAQPRVFVHRDYHSRNLMVCPQHNPGIVDFQDAVEGPISYDLVSLLKDCYLRWPQADRERWIAGYHEAASGHDLPVGGLAEFTEGFNVMGVQRHLKAAGIFARLCHRDGKSGYLADIPRTLGYVMEVARLMPQLRAFGDFLDQRVLAALRLRPARTR